MDPRLVDLALAQHGVFALADAGRVGVNSRAVHRAAQAGTLVRTFPQVFRLAAAPESWESNLMGAQLWLGPESSISHASAAALWEFPGFIRERVELSTPRPKKPLPPVVVHKASVDLCDHTTTVGPIRVTNVGRTLVDIAGRASPDLLERCVEDALRRRLTSMSHLRWLLSDRKGKGAKGIAEFRRLLEMNPGSVTGSDFEVRLMQALRRASLPIPVRQHEVFDGTEFIARVDFAYPHCKVAIEADGYRFHSGRQAWEHDLLRRSALTALGWLVINVSHQQLLTGLDGVVDRVRRALMPSLET